MPAGDASDVMSASRASPLAGRGGSGAVRTRSDASRDWRSRFASVSVRRWLRADRADRAVITGSSSTWAARSNAATSSAKAALSAARAAVSRSKRARSSD